MKPLMEMFAGYLGEQVEQSLKRAVSPVGPYLKGLAFGVACLFVGSLAFSLTLVLLGLALFMAVAGYANLVDASLWTALPAAVVCLIFILAGLRLLRRPR